MTPKIAASAVASALSDIGNRIAAESAGLQPVSDLDEVKEVIGAAFGADLRPDALTLAAAGAAGFNASATVAGILAGPGATLNAGLQQTLTRTAAAFDACQLEHENFAQALRDMCGALGIAL